MLLNTLSATVFLSRWTTVSVISSDLNCEFLLFNAQQDQMTAEAGGHVAKSDILVFLETLLV